MNKEEMKKKIDLLEEAERDILRDLLGSKKKDDLDLVDAVLKIEKRIGDLEESFKKTPEKTPEKKRGLFDQFFE